MTEKQSLRREKVVHLKSIQELQEQVDMCKGIAMLKQMMDETQHTAEILPRLPWQRRESASARAMLEFFNKFYSACKYNMDCAASANSLGRSTHGR